MVDKLTLPSKENAVQDKINEIIDNLGGGNPNPAFGTSSTGASTAQKIVSIPEITSLEVGQVLYIKPSATSTVANSTIKLNDFDPYPMRYNNANITTSTDSIVWGASFVSIFVFDGTYWQFAGHGLDSNTTYSGMSISEGTTGTATTTRVLTAANLKGIIQGTKLTGLSTSDSSDVVATDTVLSGIGKLQAQINASKILINITYDDLVTLKTNEELYEGAFYRITDYVTTCNGYTPRTSPNEPSRSVGHQFDIIIQALSTSTLADKGTASIHEGDTYFANSNLGGWTVYYDIENDTNKYKWADTENGKGVIYRLIDENNNDLPFDFKNIQFYRDSANYTSIASYLTASDNYYYAFSLNTSGTITDYSIDGGSYCINNEFKALGVGQGIGLFNSVWVVNATATEVSNNDIGSNSYNNTCCGIFQRNHISKGSMINNIINDACRNNTIGAHFRDNIIGTTFENNTAGNYFSYNTLGNTFSYNTIGENVNHLTTGTTFKYCSLGNYCSYLTFGNSIQTDVFENYVRYMTIPASLLNLRVEKYTVGTSASPLDLTGLPTGAKYSITLRRDLNAGFLATWNDGITIYGKYKATSGTANWTDVNNKQIQSDWNQSDSTAVDYIKNKPTIPSGVIVDQTYDGTSTNAQSGVAIEGELTTNYQSKLVSGTNIKTVNNTSLLGGGNIDTSEVFVAEYGVTSYAGVYNAYNAGKAVFVSYNNGLFPLIKIDTSLKVAYFSNVIYLSNSNSVENIFIVIHFVQGSWVWDVTTYIVEQTSNKVTSLSSSSTDEEYPSAKCVYDELTDVVRQETTDTINLYCWSSSSYDFYTTIETLTVSNVGDPVYNTNYDVIGEITNVSSSTQISVRPYEGLYQSSCIRDSSKDTTFIRQTLTDNNSNALNIVQSDGQWVQSFITLMSSNGTKNGVQVDLSSYLPNDSYNYNVKFSLRGYDDDSSYYYHIETDIFDDGDTSTGNSNYLQLQGGTYSRQNVNIFDLPVGTGRYIKVYGSGADNIFIYALGYRRLGTNS